MSTKARKLLVSAPPSDLTAEIRTVAVNAGLDVKLTQSAREFQQAFVPFDPALIALYLQLPDMPWYELLYWISEVTAPPKLLLLSDDGQELITAVRLAADWQLSLVAALYKPFDLAELERLLVLGAEG